MKYILICIASILAASLLGCFLFIEFAKLKERHLAALDEIYIHQRNEEMYNTLTVKYGKEIVRQNFLAKSFLISPEDSQVSIDQLLLTGTKLIYRFNESQCNSCYSSQFQKLASLRKKLGKEAILLIASFNSSNTLAILKQTYKLDLPIYNINLNEWTEMPMEQFNQPYMFLMSTDTCMNFFIPDKNLPRMTDLYLEQVALNIE